jgi:hypothetical protein
MRRWLFLFLMLAAPLAVSAQATCVPDTNCIQLPTSPFITPTRNPTATRFIPPNSTQVTGQPAATATRTRTPSALATSTGTPAGTPAFGQGGGNPYATVAPERFPRSVFNLPVPSFSDLPSYGVGGQAEAEGLQGFGNELSAGNQLAAGVEGFIDDEINLTPQYWELGGNALASDPGQYLTQYEDNIIFLFSGIKGMQWTMFGKLTPLVYMLLFIFLWQAQSLALEVMLQLFVRLVAFLARLWSLFMKLIETVTP